MQDAEQRRPRAARDASRHTVDDAADSLRRQIALEGARKSYVQGCESMHRVHVTPVLGDRPLEKVTSDHIEALAATMLAAGRSPKTVRNVMSFLQVFEHAMARKWITFNPVRDAAKPKEEALNRREPRSEVPHG